MQLKIYIWRNVKLPVMIIFQMKYLRVLLSLRLVVGDYFQFLALLLCLQA